MVGSYAGDNGPAASASLNGPQAIVFDRQGNLYISDTNNNRIRKITNSGIIVTVAGVGVAGFGGDGGQAVNAALDFPTGMAVDSAGNVFFADLFNQRIRKISPQGIINTVAGNGRAGYSGDGGLATSAALQNPEGVTVDQANNLYIADNHNHRIRKVSASDGIITTAVGTGSPGYNGDGILAVAATIQNPTRVALDPGGSLLIADTGNQRIRRVDAVTQVISTIAGTGTQGYWGDGGPATKAQLNIPHNVFVEAGGGFLVAEYGNSVVRTIASDGTIESLSMALNNVTAGPVRMVYLYPSDTTPQQYYANGMERAIQSLQIFYRNQMGNGATFQLHNPVVETYALPHQTSWYQTQGAFWDTVLADAFKLTGGGFNDPHNRWVYYIQANPACGQQGAISGGTSGVALMPLGDLRGVAGRDDQAPCPGQVNAPTDYLGRWIGGLGHELGHAFNLPHPPQCQNPQPGDPPCDPTILMWTGYITYPDAVLPSPYPSMLEAGGFFVPTNLTSDLPSTLSSPLTGGPTLTVSPQTLSFKYTAGSGPPAQTINATSSGDSFLIWAQNSSGNLLLGNPYPQATPASISVTPQYTEPGTYSDGVDVFTGGASNGSQHIPVTVTVLPNPATIVTVASVVNAEGGSTTIAPNTWVAISGSALAPVGDSRTWQGSDFVNNQMPVQLDGVSVMMNGENAFVYYISLNQVNVLTPPDLAPGPVQVTITTGRMTSATFTAQAQQYSPSFFIFGAGPYIVATHADGSLIGPASLYPGLTTPAAPDEVVILYANGFGPVSPPVAAGSNVQSGILPVLPVIQIGGISASVQFAGLVSPGLFQFNVVVPATAQTGDNVLTAQHNGLTTQAGVLLTVQSSNPPN